MSLTPENQAKASQFLEGHGIFKGNHKLHTNELVDIIVKYSQQVATHREQQAVKVALETTEAYLRRRIKELNDADAKFCADRWDMDKPKFIRQMMRESSNSVTLARQELEAVLEAMGLPRFVEEPAILTLLKEN